MRTVGTRQRKHQMELDTYICEENKMFKTCVQVSFFLQADNLLKVRVIDMSIHAEQALEYCLHNIRKIGWKWCACSNMDMLNSQLF